MMSKKYALLFLNLGEECKSLKVKKNQFVCSPGLKVRDRKEVSKIFAGLARVMQLP
jgi:hypothetical protein